MKPRVKLREAPYALRLVRRLDGDAAIVYRRSPNPAQRDRFQRIAAIPPLALTAGAGLLRRAVRDGALAREASSVSNRVPPRASEVHPVLEKERGAWPPPAGPYQPLRAEWGTRLGCYALIVRGLRDPDRLTRAAHYLQDLPGPDAAWWLSLVTGARADRAIRALRILAEAVV